MTRWLGAVLALQATLVAALLTVALDMFAHKRVERLGGVNIWGYRGGVLRRKQPNEIRIALAGGDLAFAWGVAASETTAANIRSDVSLVVDKPGRPLRVVTAVNLGATGLRRAEYSDWISHFAYLHPDVICLMPDPADHVPGGLPFLPDRGSLAFVLFGYSPILPLVVTEKGAAARWSFVQRAGHLLEAISRFTRVRAMPSGASPRGPAASSLDASIDDAVQAALRSASRGVVLIEFEAIPLSPELTRDGRVRIVNLGGDARMRDAALRLDGVNLSAAGHAVAAQLASPAVVDLLDVHP